jgi:hypothetical protein
MKAKQLKEMYTGLLLMLLLLACAMGSLGAMPQPHFASAGGKYMARP